MQPPLWAPWRMKYLVGPRDTEACVFCEYASHKAPAFREDLTLFGGEHAFVTMNRFPYAGGHLLIIPRRHVADLSALEPGEHDALFRLVTAAAERLKKALRPDGLNIGMNLGASAGAGIAAHLHAHVVPRWTGDNNFMPVLADVRVISQALEETWALLAPLFADLPGEHAEAP